MSMSEVKILLWLVVGVIIGLIVLWFATRTGNMTP